MEKHNLPGPKINEIAPSFHFLQLFENIAACCGRRGSLEKNAWQHIHQRSVLLCSAYFIDVSNDSKFSMDLKWEMELSPRVAFIFQAQLRGKKLKGSNFLQQQTQKERKCQQDSIKLL